MTHCDVLICGTGSFAARIAFDLAATTNSPMHVTIAGRNRALGLVLLGLVVLFFAITIAKMG